MDKYIYDESKWAIIVYGMSCRGIIIFLALLYQPKKKTSLSAYGDNDTNAICRNIKGQFTDKVE